MKTPKYVNLNKVYSREETFNKELSKNLSLLNAGRFNDESQVEALVGTRKADIVAKGDDGTLVVESQFGKADWDHWGRLEAYARIKEANTAVLVAEKFEPLMIETCDLRNQQDRAIDWYLIKAFVTEDKLHIFHTVAGPAIDIQTERTGAEYSEFWAPIREKGLFAGKPVPAGDSWITKGAKGAGLDLIVNQSDTKVKFYYKGDNRIEKRDKAYEVLSELGYEMILGEAAKHASILFPVIDKGKKDINNWEEIREKLIKIGTDVYNKINESKI